MSFGSSHPLVTARGGALVVRDGKTANIVASLIAALPCVSRESDEAALKGLLVQNRLLASDIYGGGALADLGYLYAHIMGDAMEFGSLFDDDYLMIAAHEALAERDKLAAAPKTNLMRRFHRWMHPSTAIIEIGASVMGDLSAAIAELHFDRVNDDGERRARLAKLYHSELVRLDQVSAVDLSGESGTDQWPLHYPVLLGSSVSRSRAIQRCRRAGFEVGPFYYPRPLSGLFPYYKLCRHTAKYLRGGWRVASSLLNLPLHQGIDEMQAARLVRALKG
jgi:dTDP-4-amino-4,6-dideoxygalactose transaminase